MSSPDETKELDGGSNGSGGGEGQAAAAPPPDDDTLDEKREEQPEEKPAETIARLEREKREAHERMLRIAADFENYKKRVRRDVDDAVARAREQLLKDILPVLDNFERALQAVGKGGTVEALAQGVKLVEKQLHAALEKSGVKGFEAKGEAFDPARH